MSKQASEEENKELTRVEKRLKELSKCELFLDNIFIKDKTARQIIISAYNKLERQQKEIKELKETNNQLVNYLNDSYYVSADKIKKKIKELKNIIEFEKPTYENYLKYTIDILEELLEEK